MAKILLIDSDRANRQILEHAFMLYEHDVVSTQYGDEGIKLATTEAPDIIVMDLDARGLNGWQAIKILKQSIDTQPIPVIAMAKPTITGQMLLQTGFDTYERKPISAGHLLQAVETRLEPAAPAAFASDTQAISEDDNLLSRTTVVYIADNLADSNAMAEIVHGAGYSYTNISDSLRALSQLVDHSPQLIFLEAALPVANGYELCAQIRRISLFKQTPIILVANSENLADRVRARVVGASGFLSKPLKPNSVLKHLIKYLSSSLNAT